MEFAWSAMRAVLDGASAIDVPTLSLDSLEAAKDFLASYGFAWPRASHRRELERLRRAAIALIEEDLLTGLDLETIPEHTRSEFDVRRLLLASSGVDASPEVQAWACALLRVMHTLAHCGSHFNERYAEPIRAQIFARLAPHLTLQGESPTLGRGADAVVLDRFEVKHTKPTRSVALKLLHKPEHVATDIFDRVGLRFVTRDRLDALLVVRYLLAHNLVMFANIKPSRSRNTLVDLRWLEDAFARSPRPSLDSLRDELAHQPFPHEGAQQRNVFSSTDYRSIQFTCRQMVRVPDAAGEVSFFFPFEIQVLDRASFEASRTGRASHDDYRRRQTRAAQLRVLGPLLARYSPDRPQDDAP